jgi:predicted deacylase
MSSLFEQVMWQHFPLAAGAAVGTVSLSIGQVGTKGPTALVTAGVHGDEGPWGAWAIRKLLKNTSPDELLGTLRIVPVSNPFAMEADARNAPFDTLDLNRQFPGDHHGSHTERLAALLTEQALKDVDTVIDLHGGGSWCVNAFAFQMPGGEALVQAVGAPFIVSAPDRTVTLTGYARSQGAVVAAVEMGGRSEAEEQWANRIAAGLRRALGVAGVLTPSDDAPPSPSIPVGETVVLRPSRGGVFIPEVRAASVGTIVNQGTVLGYLMDPVSQNIVETFTAPFERTAVLLLRPMMARVEGGAMIYVLAEPRE